MLMFVSIETTRDRSHIIAEDLCPVPVEKYIAGEAMDCGIQGWTRRNNLVQLKQRQRRLARSGEK